MRAVLALTLIALSSLAFAMDDRLYQPSSQVKEFHRYQFELTDSYLNKILWNSLPLVIIGIAFFLAYVVWSCGGFCCKCMRTGDKIKMSPQLRLFMIALLVFSAIAGIALLIYGLVAESRQQDALDQVPSFVAAVIALIESLIVDAQLALSALQVMVSTGDTLLSAPGICSQIDCLAVQLIVNQSKIAITNVQTILGDLSTDHLQSANSDVHSEIDRINRIRHIVMLAFLVPMFVALFLQAALTLANAFLPPGQQPRSIFCCRPVEWTVTGVVLVYLIAMWLFAAILLAISIVSADFCIAPDANLVSVFKVDNNIALYYINCGRNPSLVNPLDQYIDPAEVATRQIFLGVEQLNASVQGETCSDEPLCQGSINNISSSLVVTFSAIGLSPSGQRTNGGLLSLSSCKTINGIWQGVLNVVCGNFFESIATTCKVFLGFACLLVLLELFRRVTPIKHEPPKQLYEPLMDMRTHDPTAVSSTPYPGTANTLPMWTMTGGQGKHDSSI